MYILSEISTKRAQFGRQISVLALIKRVNDKFDAEIPGYHK